MWTEKSINELIGKKMERLDTCINKADSKIYVLQDQVRCSVAGHNLTCSGEEGYGFFGFKCTKCSVAYSRHEDKLTPSEKKCKDACFS